MIQNLKGIFFSFYFSDQKEGPPETWFADRPARVISAIEI